MDNLKLLIVEDRAEDADLMVDALFTAGLDPTWERVETEQAFLARLTPDLDLILADYTLPQFDGLRALRLLQESKLDIPFILISETMGEDLAVRAMRAGATDYLLKAQPARLGQAVVAALEQKRLRREKQRLDDELVRTQQHFRALIEKSADAIVLIDPEGTVLYASSTITRILGGEPGYWLGGNWLNRAHADDLPTISNLFARVLQAPGESLTAQFRYRHMNGTWLWLEATGTNLLAEPSVQAIVGNIRDITERKHAEQSLQESEERFRRLFAASPDAILLLDPTDADSKWPIVDCNEVACQMNGYTRDELIGQSIDLLNYKPGPPAERAAYLEGIRRNGFLRVESLHRHKNGHLIPIETSTSLITVGGRELVLGIDRDVSERKHAEAEIAQRAAKLSTLNRIGHAISTLQNIDELLEVIYREVQRSLPLDSFYAGLYNSETMEFTYRLMYDEGKRYQEQAGTLLQDTHLGQVVHTGVRILVNRSAEEMSARDSRGRLANVAKPSASLLFAPLQIGQRIIGAISAQSYTPNAYTEEDLALLAGIANQAAIAIENARLYEESNQQVLFLGALRAIDMAISGSVDLGLTLDILLDQVVMQLKVDASAVLLLNRHTNTLEYAAARGFRTRGIERANLQLGVSLAGRAALERRTVSAPDLAGMSTGAQWLQLLGDEQFEAYYGVPLITKGRVTGVLEIFHREALTPTPSWLKFMEALAGQAAIAIDNATLFQGMQRSNLDLAMAYDATIEGWSSALDLRDKETEGHSQRVTDMTVALARQMKVCDEDLVQIRRGALLHDIGKMGIPDGILRKPGKLTEEEWLVMRMHPELAYQLLGGIAYLRPALEIPYCHHEKWDGTGYPRGLRGQAIPLSARIFAVVDVWDALRSDRPYRKAWQESAVREYIASEAGKHFDPTVVDVFLSILEASDWAA